MEILRKTPFPLILVQEGLDASTEYVACFLTSHGRDLIEVGDESDSNGDLSITLPDFFSRYDDTYLLEVYESLGIDENDKHIRGPLKVIDSLTVIRPYFDVTPMSEKTGEDEESLRMYESISRSIINAFTNGFEYKRSVHEVIGNGSDYMPVPFRLNRVLKVLENSSVVFNVEEDSSPSERTYIVTPDHTAVTLAVSGPYGYNRMDSRPVVPYLPASDSFTLYNTNDSPNIIQNMKGSPFFPEGWDYTFVLETGWAAIPQEIQYASRLLINDLKCDNLPYANAYISEYKSDQFSIKFEAQAFERTGNGIVDNILEKYKTPMGRMGVL
jgi:hypothetical protein